jgi:hypothetical protein
MIFSIRIGSTFSSMMIILAGLIIATSCAPTKRSAYFRINKEVEGDGTARSDL